MANNLSFAVAINLLTENFRRGSNQLKSGLRSIQMQAMAMFAAFGAGSIGLGSFVSDLLRTARETSRVSTALKNVSGDLANYNKNQQFLIDLSKKYGLYINDLTSNYAGFTAAASASNMTMADQQKIFESLSRAAVSFGMSSDQSNGMFLAVQQMMSKGKVSAEELRGQLGERLPIAMQAMARAAGVSVAGLDDIMKKGKLMSADVLPRFADELNKMIPNVNTDNVETSFNKIKNSFKELTDKLNVPSIYKSLLDQTSNAFQFIINNLKAVGNVFVNLITTIIISKGVKLILGAYKSLTVAAEREYRKQALAAGTSFDAAAFAANKFGLTLKFALTSAFKAFLPLAIISGIVAITQKLVDYNNKQKEIKAIWGDYQKSLKNAGNTSDEITKMQSLLRVMNDKKSSQNDINKAQGELMGMLNLEKASQEDINKAVKKRIELLKDSAKAQIYTDTIVNSEKKIDDLSGGLGLSTKDMQSLVTSYLRNNIAKNPTNEQWANYNADIKNAGVTNDSKLRDAIKTIAALNYVVNDANKQLDGVITKSTSTTDTTTTTTTPIGGTKPELTDLQKVEKDYEDELKKYTNQLKNGVISQNEHNELVNKLNKDVYGKIGGMLSPAETAKNKTFNLAKQGVLNPLGDEAQIKLDEAKKKYTDSIAILHKQNELGYINNNELNDELSKLTDSTIQSIIAIDNIGNKADEYVRSLINAKKDLKKDVDLSRYDYNSPFELMGKTENEIIEINLRKAKDDLEELKRKAKQTGEDLTKELDAKLLEIGDLDIKLNLNNVKSEIKDLQKQLNGGIYGGLKDLVNTSHRLAESFKNIKNTLNDVDATGWEKFLSIFDALVNTIDGITGVISVVQNLVEISNRLMAAKEAQAAVETIAAASTVTNAGIEAGAITAKAAVEIATAKAVAGAYGGQMAAATAAAYAPLMVAGLPLAAAQIAAYEGMIMAASLPKFETGGIVGGNKFTGDKVLIRVNSGEMILNKKQQSNLFNHLNSGAGGSGGGKVEFVIDGKTLKGVLNNFDSIKSKIK